MLPQELAMFSHALTRLSLDEDMEPSNDIQHDGPATSSSGPGKAPEGEEDDVDILTNKLSVSMLGHIR
jgi:hypothetical protein